MKIINRRLDIKGFKEYISQFNFGILNPNKLVIHHTWKPRKDQWKGMASIQGLKSFYERKRWHAGPHLFIAEDGIWLFSPMNKPGIHSGAGNFRSIGIEIVGDYDTKKWEGKTKEHALGAIKALMIRLGLNTEHIKFHNDYSTKSCPGHAITKEWLFRELNFYDESDVPNWKDVANGKSAEEVWDKAKEKGYVSKQSKFNDPLTKGELMIILARLNPRKF